MYVRIYQKQQKFGPRINQFGSIEFGKFYQNCQQILDKIIGFDEIVIFSHAKLLPFTVDLCT